MMGTIPVERTEDAMGSTEASAASRIRVTEVGVGALDAFIALPFRLYRKEPFWVPDLRSDQKKMLKGVDNEMYRNGPHAFFLAREGRKVVARVQCGIDYKMKDDKENYAADPSRDPLKETWGYFALFETETPEAGCRVLGAAERWCRERGATHLLGPWSPDDGESHRGVLVDGFDGPPAVLNTYNFPWYDGVMASCGFRKWEDLFALLARPEDLDLDRLAKIADYSEKRIGFRVDQADLSQREREVNDVYKVLVGSYPKDWANALPSRQYVDDFVKQNLPILDPHLIHIARRQSDDEPLAFVIGVPDMNDVLIHMRSGRLSPINVLRFLYWRKRVKGARGMMQFALPEYRQKGVMAACYARSLIAACKQGYQRFDASTIGEKNLVSWKSMMSAGGRIYRTYRYYWKVL
jgi:hypothetical protein